MIRIDTRVERYERVRVECSRKVVDWCLLSIVARTCGVCGMKASLRARQGYAAGTKDEAQLEVILRRKGINNCIEQAKDLLREIK
jgi:hypothetical protein